MAGVDNRCAVVVALTLFVLVAAADDDDTAVVSLEHGCASAVECGAELGFSVISRAYNVTAAVRLGLLLMAQDQRAAAATAFRLARRLDRRVRVYGFTRNVRRELRESRQLAPPTDPTIVLLTAATEGSEGQSDALAFAASAFRHLLPRECRLRVVVVGGRPQAGVSALPWAREQESAVDVVTRYWHVVADGDYVLWADSRARFVAPVGPDALGQHIAVRHFADCSCDDDDNDDDARQQASHRPECVGGAASAYWDFSPCAQSQPTRTATRGLPRSAVTQCGHFGSFVASGPLTVAAPVVGAGIIGGVPSSAFAMFRFLDCACGSTFDGADGDAPSRPGPCSVALTHYFAALPRSQKVILSSAHAYPDPHLHDYPHCGAASGLGLASHGGGPCGWDESLPWLFDDAGMPTASVPRIIIVPPPRASLSAGSCLLRQGYTSDTRRIGVWSTDYHIGPIGAVGPLLEGLGVAVVDKSLSGHCMLAGTCARNLSVITPMNAMQLEPNRIQIRRQFFQAYRNDVEFRGIDVVLCSHPTALCELYMPFDKSIILYATIRFELGRHHDAGAWTRWISNLGAIASQPHNRVLANNAYDAAYIAAFTGLEPEVLPSMRPVAFAWNGRRHPRSVLVDVGHASRYQHAPWWPTMAATLLADLRRAAGRRGARWAFDDLRRTYPIYRESDLAGHAAFLWLPSQVSLMAFAERYAAGIPMLVPSLSLLESLHRQFGLLFERTLMGTYGSPLNRSLVPLHASYRNGPDPNDERTREALLPWLRRCEFYSLPFITTFDSWDQLLDQLDALDRPDISRGMRAHAERVQRHTAAAWRRVLREALRARPAHGRCHARHAGRGGSAPSAEFEEAMRCQYGPDVDVS